MRACFVFIIIITSAMFYGCYPKTPEGVLKKYMTGESKQAWEYITSASSATTKFEQFEKDRKPINESDIGEIRLLQTPDPNVVRIRIGIPNGSGKKEIKYNTLKNEDGKWKVPYTAALVSSADEARKADHIDESIGLLKQALLIDQYCSDCKYALSQTYLHYKGSLDDAENQARSNIEDEPDVGWGYFALAVVLNAKKNFADAEKNFDQALSYGLTESDIKWPLVFAQLQNKNIDKAKKTIDALMYGTKPIPDEYFKTLFVIIDYYELEDLIDKYKDILEANAEQFSTELKCEYRFTLFRHALKNLSDKAGWNEMIKKIVAMKEDAVKLKKDCPDLSERCNKYIDLVNKLKMAQDRQRNLDNYLASEEGRTAVMLRQSLGERGLNRLLRCLESISDGIKAAVGQGGSNSYMTPINAISYYNEVSWCEKFKLIKRFVRSRIGSDPNQWFARKKLWEDWCYFDDGLARKIAEIEIE